MGLRINEPLAMGDRRPRETLRGVDASRVILFPQAAPAGDYNGANPEAVESAEERKRGSDRILNTKKAQEGLIVVGIGLATGVRRLVPLFVLFLSPWLIDAEARQALVESLKRVANRAGLGTVADMVRGPKMSPTGERIAELNTRGDS